MRKILIPTDFSDDSIKAYQVAASIAKEKNFSIHLYHIVETHLNELAYWIYGVYGLTKVNDDLHKDIERAHSLLEEHSKRAEFDGIKITTSVSESTQSPSKMVVEEINKPDYELVIVGTSTTYTDENEFSTILSRYTRRPLMIVKNHLGDFKMKNTLICIDFDLAIRDFLDKLAYFATDTYQNYDFLVINTPDNFKSTDEIDQKYKEFILRFDLTRTQLIVRNDYTIQEGVRKAILKWNYDVVALIAESKKSWQYLFMGNDTEEVIKNCQQSVFLMNIDKYNPEPVFSHNTVHRNGSTTNFNFQTE